MRVCLHCGKRLGRPGPRSRDLCLQCFGAQRRTGYLTPAGYRRVGVGGRYVMEHRFVMEQAIGRALLGDEEVHHLNGRRDDNRLVNLRLVSSHADHLGTHHRARWRCPQCGTIFERSPKYGPRFCSRPCFYIARTGKPVDVTFPTAERV